MVALARLPDSSPRDLDRDVRKRALRRAGAIGFSGALLACAAIGLVPRLPIALHQFIEYDGWWHVFISRQPLWIDFLSEVGSTAHPPLFFLALRVSQSIFGYSRFAYRFVSLGSGISIIPLLGWVARRGGNSALTAAAVALVVALSPAAIVVSCEVRSYALALLFMILSFAFLAELLVGKPNGVTVVLLALSSGAAIASHYFGFLFTALEIGIVVLAVCLPEVRRRVLSAINPLAVATVSVVALAATVLYVVHARHFAGTISHLPVYFFDWHGSESMATFFLRNLQSFVGLFFPIATGSRPAAAAIAVTIGSALFIPVIRRPRSAAALSALITLGMFVLIVAASLARIYPFGGELRQQFFIFPFLVLALAGAIDEAFAGRRAGMVIVALIAVAAVVNCAAWWKSFPIEGDELYTTEYRRFLTSFGSDRTVAVDRFSLIVYFTHNHERQWVTVRRNPLERVIEYAVGPNVRLVLDRLTWNYDVSQKASLLRLHEVARTAQKTDFTLFSIRQFPDDRSRKTFDETSALRARAQWAGLAPGALLVDSQAVFGRFSVLESVGDAPFRAIEPVPAQRRGGVNDAR